MSPVRASAVAYAGKRSGSGAIATGGTLGTIQRQGGTITLNTNVQTEEITTASKIGTLSTQNIVASVGSASTDVAAAAFVEESRGRGGTATSGTIGTVQSQGGIITLSTNVQTGDITTSADIGTLSIGYSTAFAHFNARVSANTFGSGGSANGGTVGPILSQGAAIALSTNIQTGEITTASDIGTLNPQNIDASASVVVEASASTDADGNSTSNRGERIEAKGGLMSILRGEQSP